MRELEELLENRVLLKAVEYERTDILIWRVRLTFDTRVVVIGVDEDTDAIVVAGDVAPQDSVVDDTESSPWRTAIGKPLFAAWRMINHNGTEDGIQLQFGETVSDPTTTVQLLAIGSTVQIFAVQAFNRRLR